jgi:2-keto-3-deoxy-L-rhamnonate aldolase RhmA
VPGVDALMIGTNDFCAEAASAGNSATTSWSRPYETVVAACREHKTFAGMGGVGSNELMAKYVTMGAQSCSAAPTRAS